MGYTYLLYLLIFLPGTLLLYAVVPQRARGVVLLLASYVFFFQLSRKLILYLFLATLVTYGIGLWLELCQRRSDARIQAGADRKAERAANTRRRRAVLWLGIALLGGTLLFLKFFESLCAHLNLWIPSASLPVIHLALPLGISFYTLEAIAYLVDVYYQKTEAEHNLGRIALFLSFFPKIMEGPICRYSQVARPLWEGRQLTYQNLTYGAQRLLWGLFKKLIIADRLNTLVGNLFGHYGQYQGGVVALGAVLYTFQLYADFSGCIDMTIGTGEMFGLKLPENFRQPFFAKSPSEFWRRWHISLSSWLRDYVYISLGGNRKGKARTYLNLLITMLLGGLWHGANIRFVLWGAMHGVALAIHKFFLSLFPQLGRTGAEMSPVWRIISVIITFHFVCFTWIFFRMGSIDGVWDMLTMITEEFHPEVIPQFFAGYRMVTALIIIGFILHFSPDRWRLALQSSVTRAPLWAQTLLFAGVLVILTQFRSAGVQPFIYFQF